LPLVLDSQRLRNYLTNYKTLGASRLVQKLCWQVSKWVVETNRIEALIRNRKTLKEKWSFTRVIRTEGESLTQSTNKSEPTWLMGPKVSKASGKMVIGRILAYLSSFLLAAASAAEPAQADVALRYEAATVSVMVTSQVVQRPSFHGESVRPSGRLPSALQRPDWRKSGFGKWRPDQVIHKVMALWSTRVSSALIMTQNWENKHETDARHSSM